MFAVYVLQTISAPDFHKLDFDMSQEQREKLLIRGMEAGRRFLDKYVHSVPSPQLLRHCSFGLSEYQVS